jgi:hypothetical protein
MSIQREIDVKREREKEKHLFVEDDTLLNYHEEDRNKFDISDGNIKVLETIPIMMIEDKWRTKLRKLVLDFKSEKILRGMNHRGIKQ